MIPAVHPRGYTPAPITVHAHGFEPVNLSRLPRTLKDAQDMALEHANTRGRLADTWKLCRAICRLADGDRFGRLALAFDRAAFQLRNRAGLGPEYVNEESYVSWGPEEDPR